MNTSQPLRRRGVNPVLLIGGIFALLIWGRMALVSEFPRSVVADDDEAVAEQSQIPLPKPAPSAGER